MKPFSKSVWITPAACGAVAPTRTVQARTSFSPGGEVGLQVEQRRSRRGSRGSGRAPRGRGRRGTRRVRRPPARRSRPRSCADRHHHRALLRGGERFSTASRCGLFLEAVLGDVGDVHRRLGGEQVELAQRPAFSSSERPERARREPFVQVRDQFLQQAFWRIAASLSPPLAARLRRAAAGARPLSRSASASSVSMTSMSRHGSTLPRRGSRCRRRSSAPRARWRRSRGCWRGTGCPGPRPSRRRPPGPRCPRTPSWSARCFCGFTISAMRSSRGSGTGTMPVFGSMVQNGKFSAAMPAASAR
jgi:hypothetical protein